MSDVYNKIELPETTTEHPAFLQRLVGETNALIDRQNKLITYLEDGCPGATDAQGALLERQYDLQEALIDVLKHRVGLALIETPESEEENE